MPPIKSALILGAGSAGLLAALTLKRKFPQLAVRVVRSPELGVIGVGEGTTPNFPRFLFKTLGISRAAFFKHTQPTWKIGIRFLWGPRERFDYTFAKQLDVRWPDLPQSNGYYCDDDFSCTSLAGALARNDRIFGRHPQTGGPDVQPWHGFHIENPKFVGTLELVGRELGCEFIDGLVEGVERGLRGVAALQLKDGRRLEADLYVDASGFRSELLSKALEEPYISYDKTLFCDRAVVGQWERTSEPILPYTTAETMDAGWCWQIEHERYINRGYVYCSQAISDDEAEAEFRRKNPKLPESLHIVNFRSGRYRRLWVDNVVGVGNSGGFVEPLESTGLMVVCAECEALAETLRESRLEPTPTMIDFYNRYVGNGWDETRDFLGLHYKLNTRLDTPFWRQCRADANIERLAPFLEFYAENGPSTLARYSLPKGLDSNFGIEGWLVMMVGNRVPYRARHTPSEEELRIWNKRRADFAAQASVGYDVRQTLACMRDPRWQWEAAGGAGALPPGAESLRMRDASFQPMPAFSPG